MALCNQQFLVSMVTMTIGACSWKISCAPKSIGRWSVQNSCTSIRCNITETLRAEFEGLKLKDLKAKNYLFQAIDRSILEKILCKETSKDIWDSMKNKYQGSSRTKRVQLQALRRSFETLQMKDDELVTGYCARTMSIANKMRFHGEKMEDVAIVEKILRSLAPKYNYVACSIEESKDIDNLSLDELQSSLMVHEQKMNHNTITDEQALKASTHDRFPNSRGKGRGRGTGWRGRGYNDGGGRGNGTRQFQNFNTDNDPSQSQGRGHYHQFDKSKIECHRCQHLGHYRFECYTKLP